MSLLSQFWDLTRRNISYYASALWGQGYSLPEALNRAFSRYPGWSEMDVASAVEAGFSQAEMGGVLGFNPVYRPSPSSMPVNADLPERFRYILNVRCKQLGSGEYRYFQIVHDTDRNSNFNQLSEIADMYLSQMTNDTVFGSGGMESQVEDCGLFSITSVEYRGF